MQVSNRIISLMGRIPSKIVRETCFSKFPQTLDLDFTALTSIKSTEPFLFGDKLYFYYQDTTKTLGNKSRIVGCNVILHDYVPSFPKKLHPYLENFLDYQVPDLGDNLLITTGLKHLILASSLGNLIFGIGDNSLGQFPQSDPYGRVRRFQLPEKETVKMVASGLFHTLILTKNGRIYGCGCNTDGQIAKNNAKICPDLVEIKLPINDNIGTYIKCGNDFSFAQTSKKSFYFGKGNWYSWGNNENSQLLIESQLKHVDSPVLNALSDIKPDTVSLGAYFGVCFKEGQGVNIWGNSAPGLVTQLRPRSTEKLSIPEPIISIQASHTNIVAQSASGNLYIVGQNHDNMFCVDYNKSYINEFRRIPIPLPVHDFRLFKHLILYHCD